MITRAWVEAQIEESLTGASTRENVFDLAMLCIVRDELDRRSAPIVEESESAGDDKKQRTILLTNHSADLDKVPTIDEISDALGAVSVNTKEEMKRHRDMRTWADIIKNHS